MPNYSSSRIVIILPEFDEDDTQAQRQIRWEKFRDLKNHILEHGEDEDGENFNPFTVLRPRPADQDDNWYEWHSNNWGTKWDLCYGNGVIHGDSTLIIEGQTAWCPPIELLQYLDEELGFIVEAQHFSYENDCWGDTINGISEFNDLHLIHINEDDPENDVALEIQEWENDNGQEITDSILHHYILFGEMVVARPYTFYGEILDSDWINGRVEWEVENGLEKYENWKEQHGNGEVRESFRKMKQNLLELVEQNLELKRINEGKYLEICNKLKNITFQEAESIVEYLQTLVPDNIEHDDNWDMVHYYHREGNEPQLVEIYS
jgi:hypothetical protein